MQEQKKITIFHNPQNLLHRSSKVHPQYPERIIFILDQFYRLSQKFQGIQIKQTKFELGISQEEYTYIQQLMKQTHGQHYWQFVKQMWHQGINKSEMFINKDTYFMKHTYHAARQAVRTTTNATDELFSSNNPNHSVFSLVRPPGHHCGLKTQPHGFSFFNNLAIAVNHAIKKYQPARIAIVDWDVHHGQGTQKIFYEKSSPLFISLHRYDNGKFFPHIKQSGSQNIGIKEGEGFNINICWNLQLEEQKRKGNQIKRHQSCGDEQYAYAFSKIVIPCLTKYNPDVIFVSCGLDSAVGDIIGGLHITSVGFAFMTKQLLGLQKKCIFVLEGGYSENSLKQSSKGIILSALNQMDDNMKLKIKKLQNDQYQPNQIGKRGVKNALDNIRKYWHDI